jgi:hypothetical protein
MFQYCPRAARRRRNPYNTSLVRREPTPAFGGSDRGGVAGLVGGPLLILSFVLIMFGAYENREGPSP